MKIKDMYGQAHKNLRNEINAAIN